MAEAVEEKSRGLKFAEQQLLRHGWEHGKGLGRAENGISEAIKVKVKCDKGGVGHKEGEQFTFHWWDHVFNKASSSLQVESDQNGIKLKKTEEDEEDGMISNKKPRKGTLAKAKLYGCFVKSATLLSGQEQPEPKCSNSDDSSSSEEDDDQRLDLSSTTKLSDADLMKACGGRTAHKGARHGLTMSAKLARLEQQEAEFMAKYGKKSQPASPSLVCVTASTKSAEQPVEEEEAAAEDFQSRKMKKKTSTGSSNHHNDNEAAESGKTDINPNKKKKRKRAIGEVGEATAAVPVEHVMSSENSEVDQPPKAKRTHKKKNKTELDEGDVAPSSPEESNNLEQKAELHTDTSDMKKKKKKKKKSLTKHHSEEEKRNKTESSQSEQRDAVSKEEDEVTGEESTAKQKRKKCKKDELILDNHINGEVLIPKRKKKKSKE